MTTTDCTLQSVAAAIARAAGDVARTEARTLMRHLLDCNQAWLIAHAEHPLTPAQTATYSDWVARRAAGEPLAYIVGRREFHGLEFTVNAHVLIPRHESELIVDLALARLEGSSAMRILELGTGSGCLSVALAHRLRQVRHEVEQLLAVDLSGQALAVARANARHHEVDIEFRLSDWYSAVPETGFDLILSNPPYIDADDPHLERGDLVWEPRLALSPGADGLHALRQVIAGAHARLRPGGWLLVEHGFDQGASVRALMAEHGLVDPRSCEDLDSHPRVSMARAGT